MKELVSIMIFLFSVLSFGQKIPSDYFQEANYFFDEKNYDEALKGYQFIVDNHPKNELYPKAFYNIGYIYYIQKKYDKALPFFESILRSDFNERESSGGGIMADPFANYRHRVCEMLSQIYYVQEDFEKALYYFSLSDTAYPYLHFCGNEYASNDVHTALRYADIYQQLNQPAKAIEKLLPAVFVTLANNSKVLAELEKLLQNKKEIRQELDAALDKMYFKKHGKKGSYYHRYYFHFLGAEIAIPGRFDVKKKNFNKQKVIEEIKQTEFYKMIEKL